MTKAAPKKAPAKKAAPPKRTAPKPKAAAISVSLKVMGKTAKATGDSVQEALSNLEHRGVRGLGVLTVSRGPRTVQKIIQPHLVAGLLSPSPTMRTLRTKAIAQLFDV